MTRTIPLSLGKRALAIGLASAFATGGLVSLGTLTETGTAPAHAATTGATCGPLNVAYVLDMSTSFTDKEFNSVRAAAKSSIATLAKGSNGLNVNVSVVGFARNAHIKDARIVGKDGKQYDTVAAMKAATGSDRGKTNLALRNVPANEPIYDVNVTTASGLATINSKIDSLRPDDNFAPPPNPAAWLNLANGRDYSTGDYRQGYSASTGTNYSSALDELNKSGKKFDAVIFITDGVPNMTLAGKDNYYTDPKTGLSAFNFNRDKQVNPEIRKLARALEAKGTQIVPVYLNTTGDPVANKNTPTTYITNAMKALSGKNTYLRLDAIDKSLASELVKATVATCTPNVQIDKKLTTDPATINPGTTVTYNVTVRGAGNFPSTNVVVNDLGGAYINPDSIKILSTSKGTATGSSWKVGSLNVGEEATAKVQATITPDFVHGKTIVNDINVASKKYPTAPTKGKPNAKVTDDNDRFDRETTPTKEDPVDVQVDKTTFDNAVFKPGSTVSYRVTVHNNSKVDATNVVMDEDPQPGLTFQSMSLEKANTKLGTVNARGTIKGQKWVIGTMKPGETMTAVITVKVADNITETQKLTNDVYIGADKDPRPNKPGDPNKTVTEDRDNFDRESDDPTPLTSTLKLDKIFDTKPEDLIPGKPATFTIQVRNDGPDDDTHVVVDDVLASGLVKDSLKVIEGSVTHGTLEGTKWNIGTLRKGEIATIRVTATVAEGLNDTDQITNTARVTSDNNPPTPDEDPQCQANNGLDEDTDGCDTVTLTPKATLQVRKQLTTDLADIRANGGKLTYKVEAHNPSTISATKVIVTDIPLEGITPDSIHLTYNGETVNDADPNKAGFQWQIGTLKAGESKTATITATTNKDATHFENGVTITNPGNPVDDDPKGKDKWQRNNDDVSKDKDQRDRTSDDLPPAPKKPENPIVKTGGQIVNSPAGIGGILAGLAAAATGGGLWFSRKRKQQ